VLSAFGLVAALHLIAGWKEVSADRRSGFKASEGWVQIGPVSEIPEKRAVIIPGEGRERVAIFRYDGTISALSNACKHQTGPLGEGRIVNGVVVCPWHGYEYEPHNGCAPAPFTEKIATYRAEIRDGEVWVNIKALPAGTSVPPALIEADAQEGAPA
jgi:nitrite reductase/ring-hydroxylating ferredoxin subunit